MSYLNADVLDAIDTAQFRAQEPYPWINPQAFIRPDRFDDLLHNMPNTDSVPWLLR